MQIIKKEYKVFNFNELSEDVQEKLIEKEEQAEKDFYCETCLYEDMKEEASRLLEEFFGKVKIDEIYYSLGYCQGDGAMIEFTINIEDLNKKYKFLNEEELKLIKDYEIINEIQIYHNDNFYYHEYTFSIKYDGAIGYNCIDYEDIKDEYNISEEDFNKLEDKIINLLDTYNKANKPASQFIEDIISMNKEFTKIGYDLAYYESKDRQDALREWVLETLNENKYLENGEIF